MTGRLKKYGQVVTITTVTGYFTGGMGKREFLFSATGAERSHGRQNEED